MPFVQIPCMFYLVTPTPHTQVLHSEFLCYGHLRVNFTTVSVPTQNVDILLSSLHEIHKPDSLEVLFVLARISSPKLLIQH